MTSAPEAHKTAGVPDDVQAMAERHARGWLGEFANRVTVKWCIARAIMEDRASRSTPSVPAVAELSTAGHIERIAEAMWRAEVSDLRAAHNARQSTSLSEQSDQMREKWMRLACAAVSTFPAVAELSGGLAQPIASAAVSGWRTDFENAPKDGTPILITRPTNFVSEEGWHVVRWDDTWADDGWWVVHDGKNDHPLRGADPTRWMPLPALTASPAGDDPKDELPQSAASGAAAGWMPKVKALDWEEIEPGWWSIYQEDLRLGFEVRTTWRGTIRTRRNGEDFRDFDGDVDAAKAACQADFERRILAALDLPAPGDDPKALDAAAYKVGDFVRVISRDDDQTPHEFAIGSVHQIVEIYEDGSGVDLGDWVCRFHEIEPATRSSSTEAVEQEVERLRHLAQSRYEFMREMASELEAYGAKGWIAKVEAMARPSLVTAACKPEGDPSLPGKEEGRG